MTVRAKFTVQEITRRQSWKNSNDEIHTITLTPVVGGSKENDEFYEATPGGKIDLQVIKGSVGDQFQLGKSYYVDFTPAEG